MSLSLSKMSIAILASFLLAVPAFAGYEYPLQTPEILDAYFLGQRSNQQTIEFLEAYTKRWIQPQATRYVVTEIDVKTPYEQVVERGIHNAPGDSPVQTETDLLAHPLSFIVIVSVIYNSAYNGPDTGDNSSSGSRHGFSIQVKQKKKLASRGMDEEPFGGMRGPYGIMLTAEFDPAKVTSGPTHITVHTPDGRSVSADFDLSKLK